MLSPVPYKGRNTAEGGIAEERLAVTNIVYSLDRNITEYFKSLLRISGLRFYSSAELELVREMKEECCALRTAVAKETGRKNDFMAYKLPDGRDIMVCPC